MDRQYIDKRGAVNRRDGQTIQLQMRSSKSERWIRQYNGKCGEVNQRWTDNRMTNEGQKIGEMDRQYNGKW